MKGTEQEGFVVCDKDFNRVKMKCEQYVKLHRIKSSTSPKNFLEIVRSGEIEEVANYFPEYSEILTKINTSYNRLTEEIQNDWLTANLNGLVANNRKAFAAFACKTICPSALFSLLDRKTENVKQFLAKMQIDSLAGLVHLESFFKEGLNV